MYDLEQLQYRLSCDPACTSSLRKMLPQHEPMALRHRVLGATARVFDALARVAGR